MFFSTPFPTETGVDVGGADVLLPPFHEIFWSALIMLGLWLVLGKALPKIYAMLDERQEKIDAGLNAADKAREDAALAKREREETLRQAQEEAKEIRDGAHQDAGRIVAQAHHEAQLEAQRIAEAANRQIEAERMSAEISLRRDVGSMATDLAERIIGEQLKDQELSRRVVDRFMDEVENELEQAPVGADV